MKINTESPFVVYVEDDPMSRDVMNMLLRMGLGYQEIAIFENSADFILKVEGLHRQPDVFFLDIHMQPIDGFEMLRLLREHPRYRDSIVVALTASVMNEEIKRLRTAGFNGVIAKPINQFTFKAQITDVLHGEEVWEIN